MRGLVMGRFPSGWAGAVLSLRPEHIRVAGRDQRGRPSTRSGTSCAQAFHGATELIRVECPDGLVLVVRTASGNAMQQEIELEFSAADAVAVRESPERN